MCRYSTAGTIGEFTHGRDPGGIWSQISTIPSLAGGFNAQTGTFLTGGQPAGNYRFKYSRSSPAPCPSDEAVVEVILNPVPVADAGEDKALNCNQLTTTLGGPATSAGAGITYNWDQNGIYIADTREVFTAEGGDYSSVVTNSAGCTDSDITTVILDNGIPVADLISVQNVRCWGDKRNISVYSFTTTHSSGIVLFELQHLPVKPCTHLYYLERTL